MLEKYADECEEDLIILTTESYLPSIPSRKEIKKIIVYTQEPIYL